MNSLSRFPSLLGFVLLASPSLAATSTFKLYDEPRHQVDKACDRFTELRLTVSADQRTATATMTDKLKGTCEVLVRPNVRTYKLNGKNDGCGSFVYSAEGASNNTVELIDNRGRLCENVIAALIEVTETIGYEETRLFSLDQ